MSKCILALALLISLLTSSISDAQETKPLRSCSNEHRAVDRSHQDRGREGSSGKTPNPERDLRLGQNLYCKRGPVLCPECRGDAAGLKHKVPLWRRGVEGLGRSARLSRRQPNAKSLTLLRRRNPPYDPPQHDPLRMNDKINSAPRSHNESGMEVRRDAEACHRGFHHRGGERDH